MKNFVKSIVAATAGVLMSAAALAQTSPANFRNLVINGEALVANSGGVTLTGLNTTATYAADGVAVFANNAGASIVAGTSTANIPNGFQKAFSVQRTASNANTTAICFVQEIESSRIIPFQGQSMTFSAYLGNIGAGFSAAGSLASFTVISGTGTDQGLSSLLSGWTGATTVVNASATTALTTAYQRFGVNFTVPNTATELALEICYTPVGTASGTTDQVSTTGWQLEAVQGSCPAIPGSAGYTAQVAQACATPYEHKGVEMDTLQSARYFQQINEANVTLFNLPCYVTTTNTQNCALSLTPPMRAAPTASITAGGLQMIIDGAAATAIVSGAGATGSVNTCNWSFGNTTSAAVHSVSLRGSLTTGILACSARF